MWTITKTLKQRMERFWLKQMKLDELRQPGWEDLADYVRQSDKEYSTSELKVPDVAQLQTDDDAAATAPRTFGGLMECPDIVPGISQIPHGTSGPGSIHIRIGLVQPQSNMSSSSHESAAEHDTSPLQKTKPVERVCFLPLHIVSS
jgi:hypothetical protein